MSNRVGGVFRGGWCRTGWVMSTGVDGVEHGAWYLPGWMVSNRVGGVYMCSSGVFRGWTLRHASAWLKC